MNCPKCNADNWVMGPEGGGSQNILCSNCHTEYCESAFGLEEMKYDIERIKRLYGIFEPATLQASQPKHSIIDDMLSEIEHEMP